MEHLEFDETQQQNPAAENTAEPTAQPVAEEIAELMQDTACQPTAEAIPESVEEPAFQPAAEPTGKKASPFADSPYVMQQPPKYEWDSGFTIPPKQKKEKKREYERKNELC